MQTHKQQPYATLSDGNKIPLAGFGTFLSKDEPTLIKVIKEAWRLGCRHFDTAILYGNEDVCGKAFQEIFKEGGKREELFVTTKMFPFKDRNAIDWLKQSLKKLQLDYVDLYLLHQPWSPPKKDANGKFVWTHTPIHQMWPEFEECKKDGLAKSIGVSNFNVSGIIDLLTYCRIKPTVNQIELTPYLTQPGLVDFCKQVDIHVTAYSCLARGGADVVVKLGTKIDIFNEPILVELAKKYKKSVAQIVLAFWVVQGVSVVPKTDKVERVGVNFDIFGWEQELSKEDVAKIAALNSNTRTIDYKQIQDWQFIPYFE